MGKTAFPCCDIKTVTYQIRREIRIANKNIKTCYYCNRKIPYHQKGCLEEFRKS